MTDKRTDHIKARYGAHGSLRKTSNEFGVGKSTIHRKVKMATPEQNTSKAMRMIVHAPKVKQAKGTPAKATLKSPLPAPSINKPATANPYKKKVF